jgi:arylsulfatase A-like enzyme
MPFGGFPAFHDGETIATVLQSAGYRTGLFGKYLAGYHSSYVPPGWDRWFATYGHGGYYQYHATDDGVVVDYGNKRADYGTKVLADVTTQFIETSDVEEPLFAYVAPHAPHKPATPAPGDGHAFSALKAWRPPSYNEPDVSDKPRWLRSMPRLSDDDRAAIDAFRVDQYRSLLGVDRLVRRIVTALKDSGRLSTTLLVFTSDNGMLWGEHRLDGKGAPYEESIRVPILVRYDPLVAMPGATDHHLVLNLDLAPTFAELAGVELPNLEGRSLLSLLEGSGSGWRSHFLVEHLGDLPHGVPTFCAVRERRWVFVRYDSGRSEIYNLTHDPFELRNRIPAMKGSRTMIRLKRQLRELCDPAPPGYSIGSP